MLKRIPWTLLAVVLVSLGAALAHADESDGDAPYNPYAKILADAGVEPTPAGVSGYLQSLVPSEAERAEREALARALIEQLGDGSFARREEAMLKLAALPDPPHALLRRAADSDDPEIRWRSEAVLRKVSRPNPLPEAVCRTIEILQIQGAAPVLLKVIPQLGPPHVRRAGEDALAATARAADAALLRRAIDSDDAPLRAAAITAYAAALGKDAREELRPLLSAESVQVRLAAARALANTGDRSVLPALLQLIEHEDVDVRAAAIAVLRGLTGQQFGFLAYDDAEKRAANVKKWRDWIDEQGASAELTFPLPRFARRAEIGHTIILLYQKSKAIELNAAGETIWEKDGLNFPWAVQRLENGNTVIGSYRGKWVAEFDPSGDEVWRKDGLPGGVFGVQRLPNGNTLLGLHSAKKVVEVDRAGKIVWQVSFDGQPMGVQRLAGGNTMVALHSGNKVVEVDREGNVVWQVTDVKIPRTVQRLPNGNTLVGDSSGHRAVEFDRKGKVVWSHNVKGSVYDARRLANGNTLISDVNGVIIVNPQGQTVWEKQIQGAGRALRF